VRDRSGNQVDSSLPEFVSMVTTEVVERRH
jgi:hypothetical protein